MKKGTRQKRSHHDVGIIGAEPSLALSGQSGVDTHKKAKMSTENHGDGISNTMILDVFLTL